MQHSVALYFGLVFVFLSIDNYDAKLQQLTGW